jgi:hypothetical protein
MSWGVHCSISCGYHKKYIKTLRVHIDAFQMSRPDFTYGKNWNLYYFCFPPTYLFIFRFSFVYFLFFLISYLVSAMFIFSFYFLLFYYFFSIDWLPSFFYFVSSFRFSLHFVLSFLDYLSSVSFCFDFCYITSLFSFHIFLSPCWRIFALYLVSFTRASYRNVNNSNRSGY